MLRRLGYTSAEGVLILFSLSHLSLSYQVLRRLGYTSAEGVLGTKGRFSCELSTPDELVLTDMVRVTCCVG